jgi:arginine N-succinyltransferase
MMRVRPTHFEDVDALYDIASGAGAGMLNLPPRREVLETRIANSEKAFSEQRSAPNDELYTFVLEDTDTGEVPGTSGIYSKIGVSHPHYFYRHEKLERRSAQGVWIEEVLIPTAINSGPSEICALYLKKSHRQGGVGRLLSLSRFLYMAQFPERFDTRVAAEMRGVSQNCDFCPFWNSVGRHFLDTDFCAALEMYLDDPTFVSDILPQYPIYVSLLPKYAQRVIGKAHPRTQPALNMLRSEGFASNGLVDVFDAGPMIEAAAADVRSIAHSRLAQVSEISDQAPQSVQMVVSNTNSEFLACFAKVESDGGQTVVSQEVADTLEIGIGDLIRYVPSRPEKQAAEDQDG